jgi:nucleotide-binding universal stress UspA family protein
MSALKAAKRSGKAASRPRRASRSTTDDTTRVLLAVDGSKGSLRAVAHLNDSFHRLQPLQVRLLNVQTPIPLLKRWGLKRSDIVRQQQQQGQKALHGARLRLDGAGIKYDSHVAVGPVAQTIVRYAKQWQCDSILIGTRGLGMTAGLVLGSIAIKVIHLARTPVTLVN